MCGSSGGVVCDGRERGAMAHMLKVKPGGETRLLCYAWQSRFVLCVAVAVGYARPSRIQLIVLRTVPTVLIPAITLFIVLLCVM